MILKEILNFVKRLKPYGVFQDATIRLSDCSGQSLFGSGNSDLHYTCPVGQVLIRSKLAQILSVKL